MNFDNLIDRNGETVQIWGQSSDTDGLGNTFTTWDVDKGTFTGVVVKSGIYDVALEAGRITTSDRKLIAPSDADIAVGDRLEIDGVKYDCYGSDDDWKVKLNGVTQYKKLFLKRVVE
jgi:hypothetical protein